MVVVEKNHSQGKPVDTNAGFGGDILECAATLISINRYSSLKSHDKIRLVVVVVVPGRATQRFTRDSRPEPCVTSEKFPRPYCGRGTSRELRRAERGRDGHHRHNRENMPPRQEGIGRCLAHSEDCAHRTGSRLDPAQGPNERRMRRELGSHLQQAQQWSTSLAHHTRG